MKNIVVCWTPFNSFVFPFKEWKPGEPHPILQPEWILKRYGIWYKFTYQSIAQQDCDFIYLIACNILSKNITDSVFKNVTLPDKRVRLLYYGCHQYFQIIKELREEYNNVFAVRIDSDDSYSQGTFRYIKQCFSKGDAAGFFLRGYGYFHKTGAIYNYDCINSGPFYVMAYSHGMYRFDPIDHTYVKKMGAKILEDGHFMVNVHSSNHSSIVKPPYFGREIYGNKVNILKRFGLK